MSEPRASQPEAESPAVPPDDAAIWVHDLAKTYRAPLSGRRIQALRGISFSVGHGEVFGFLGPNGAGKTTSIRVLMGLISATRGRAVIFGHPIPSRLARQKIGFLPEAPYFYDYLTVAEMLDLAGRLYGVDRGERRDRAAELIDRVGLSHATGIPLKKYSKGMLQRAGIAQALISDPDLIVLDEPLSGLDPAGRKDVLDIIGTLRQRQKTVFFSSHILTDVEHVSDRIAILAHGRIQAAGALSELSSGDDLGTEVTLRLPEGASRETLADTIAELPQSKAGDDPRTAGGQLTIQLPVDADVDAYLAAARQRDARVVSVAPRRETLEELFIRHTRNRDRPGLALAQPGHSGQETPGEETR